MALRPAVAGDILRLLDHPPVREIPHGRQIFVNRNLRLDTIDLVGFDMDYTLAIYRLRKIEELSFQMTLRRLVDSCGYPPEIGGLEYDWEFVIRGLAVDKQHGNLFKLDRFNHVGRCYHGRRPLPADDWRRLYRDVKIRLSDSARFAWIDTLFALPEAALFAQIIERLEGRGMTVDYGRLYDDIRTSIDGVHRDDTLKAVIRRDLDGFFVKDPEIGPALHKLRSGGKKLFLLTNSLFDYTDVVLGHLLDGLLPEYPSWRQYFDFIVVGARKPGFFSDRAPLLELDGEGRPVGPAGSLERGRIYQGGNLTDFERLAGLGGERVLYVGDHIYGDILRSKKSSLWRTCMVVQELEDELEHLDRHAAEVQRLSEEETLRPRLDDELNQRKLALNLLEKKLGRTEGDARLPIENERRVMKSELEQVRRALRDLNLEIQRLEDALERGMNRYWGLLFKEGNENSRFGEQVENYADLYTSRASNFLAYSPMQYFRSPRAAMPHERGEVKLAPFGEDRL